jgi:hypothetical protein
MVPVVRVMCVYWIVLSVWCVSDVPDVFISVLSIVSYIRRRRHHRTFCRTEKQLPPSSKFDARAGLLKYSVKKCSRVFYQCENREARLNLCLTQVRKLLIKPNACKALRKQPGYLSCIIHIRNPQQCCYLSIKFGSKGHRNVWTRATANNAFTHRAPHY